MEINKGLSIKRIVQRVLIVFVIFLGLSVNHPQPMPLIRGLVFGLALSLLNFRLMYITFEKSVQLPVEKAKQYASSRYIIRYLFTGICVFISIKAPYINVLGTILGLVILKFTILLSNMFLKRDLSEASD